MKQNTYRNYIKNALPLLLLSILVIAAFARFMYDNRKRITSQNEVYLEDLTVQRAVMIDNLFAENVNYIRSTAFLYGVSIGSAAPDYALLKYFEQSTGFERLRFIDSEGNDHTSEGLAANVADREYFRSGMEGNTGVTYVLNSRVTNETQIGFYSPVYFDDEIIGIMVGFYGEQFIEELIDFELFGHKGEGWLCLSDGTVIGTTASQKEENYLNSLEISGSCTVGEMSHIKNTFSTKSNTLYTYTKNEEAVSGYIANLEQADWVLVRSFPAEAATQMLRNANTEGVELLLILVALFLAYAIFLVVRFIRQRKRLVEESRNANDISTGVSKLFEKFQTVDLTDDTYNYIYGMPDDKALDTHGRYEDFCHMLLSRIKNDDERQTASDFLKLDNLREIFSKGAERLTIRLHAPIEDDEWFTYNFIALEKDGGQIKRMLIIRQNVTELREKELQEQEALKKAYEEAERANRAKSDFLSSMSHDIRTPMNAIIGFTSIARNHIDDTAQVSDCLEKIGSSSSHLLSLINDILDMSKIESGKIQLKIEEYDLCAVLDDLADMVQSQILEKHINFTVDTDGLVHRTVKTDELRLNQVLLNIVGNAVKYTPDGGNITIKLCEKQTDRLNVSEYSISIRDTGIGMSKEYLPHVFESFTRERTSTVDKIQGTGLGMAISSRIVELMGGEITVSSEPGKGTEFVVSLPLTYCENGRADSVKEEVHEQSEVSFDGVKLLLVEDNDINAQIAGFVLKEHGFEVDRCENGRFAVDRLAEKGPEFYRIVLMDIQMPIMNGYEASRAIRALGAEYSGLPIIAMTANTFEDDRKNAFDSGMNDFVTKPFEVEDLLRTLSKYISQ